MSIYIYAAAAHARTSNLKFQDTLLFWSDVHLQVWICLTDYKWRTAQQEATVSTKPIMANSKSQTTHMARATAIKGVA